MKYILLSGIFALFTAIFLPQISLAQQQVENCNQCPQGTSCKIGRDGDNTRILLCYPSENPQANQQMRSGGSGGLPVGYECMPPSMSCPSGQVGKLSLSGSCSCTPVAATSFSGSGSSGGGADCVSIRQQMMQECQSELSDTASYCDEKNNADVSKVSDTGSQLALMFGQQTSSSIQAACSKMASFTQAANAALAGYRLACGNALSNCQSSCQKLIEYTKANAGCLSAAGYSSALVQEAEQQRAQCDKYVSKMNEAQQAIQNFGLTSAQASQCASLTSGTSLSQLKAGSVNCADPVEAAKNKVCVCATNPNDPQCLTGQSTNGSNIGSSGGGQDSSSRLKSQGPVAGDGFDIPNLPTIPQGKPNSGGSGEAVDGRQGGGALGGGGSGGPSGSSAGGSAGGAGGNGIDTNVNGGFYGGGGRSAFGGGGSGSSGGGSSYGGYAGGGSYNNKGPDLRKFLPGGQYDPRRGISGVGGPDGITGPHSNIWQKVQNRYQVMSPSLLP